MAGRGYLLSRLNSMSAYYGNPQSVEI